MLGESGNPIDLEKDYVVGALAFMASGKDGFGMFVDESVENLAPANGLERPDILSVTLEFFRSFKKDDKTLESMPPKAQERFARQLKIFNAKIEDRDEKSQAIKFASIVNQRLENIREPLTH